jgi:glycosyltransferase involved in cell wall biosynthesis
MKNEKWLSNLQQGVATVDLTTILFMTTFPPRECGIATYTQDLVKALKNKFEDSFCLTICALESLSEKHPYPPEVKYILDTDDPKSYVQAAKSINHNAAISLVVLQHEFGLFRKRENDLRSFLMALNKPVIIAFHTVLPGPDIHLKTNVQQLASLSVSLIVMTHSSASILINEYFIPEEKITVIAHGTHLVPHTNKEILKKKYDLSGRKVLSTFGLLSSGKNIEMTLASLPAIVKNDQTVSFLIIGKTHPSVVKEEGEIYRQKLERMVRELELEPHVRFINNFLPLPVLLEYLQLTDIYLFTSRDPNQAVSGTFSYALSCGCPVISTPFPHAREVLQNDAGVIVDHGNPSQFVETVCRLLNDESLRNSISSNALHKMAFTAWENSALAHALLFESIVPRRINLNYSIPVINLDHLKNMTTDFGMIQFSKFNHPDPGSGYTLDDNARALIAICQHMDLTGDKEDILLITHYFNFIKYCLEPNGNLLNYVDTEKQFTEQNSRVNLDDSNGRALWALGYLLSLDHALPAELTDSASSIIQRILVNVSRVHSTRAMAFAIKGLYYRNLRYRSIRGISLIRQLANRLVKMYQFESDDEWQWFENYLTYANSVLPEALLCAWMATGDPVYREVARSSFDFLLSKTFMDNTLQVIPNHSWLQKGETELEVKKGGEQPIDVAYTILALSKFHEVFGERQYLSMMKASFSWFLGHNHLHRIIYNPCTGGCYDGLEEEYVNLNQGAESTLSYLMARLTVEKHSSDPEYSRSKKIHVILSPSSN